MKKQRFSSTVIFLLAVTFVLFCNISQAKAQCNIVWWGEESGSVPTDETYASETATFEAFTAIFGFAPSECYDLVIAPHGYSCINSIADDTGLILHTVSLDNKCWSSGNLDTSCEDGQWNVVCSDQCDDSDSDGICDEDDNCVNSDLNANLVIDECDTSVANIINSEGCTRSDLINECTVNVINHGEFVSCAAHLNNDWLEENLITENEKDLIQSCAARAYDKDKDNILDQVDNCISIINKLQLDADCDGIGDLCDWNPGCGGCGLPACEK
jgi:hypothetical protein